MKGKKTGGRKPGSLNKRTLWVLEDLKKYKVNVTKLLADSILNNQLEKAKILISILPHIANKINNKIDVDVKGKFDVLVINRYKEETDADNSGVQPPQIPG